MGQVMKHEWGLRLQYRISTEFLILTVVLWLYRRKVISRKQEIGLKV